MKRKSNILSATLLFIALAVVAGCTASDGSGSEGTPSFEVDLDLVGEIYENPDLGLRCRPPLEWELLGGDQRVAVLESIAREDDSADFSAEVEDVFFDTNSLSFLAVSSVTGREASMDLSAYVRSFAAELGIADEVPEANSSIVTRMSFAVNGIQMEQFRHLQSGRVTFTLIFTGPRDRIIQFDYSIPTENYNEQAVKLESSIGTILILPGD